MKKQTPESRAPGARRCARSPFRLSLLGILVLFVVAGFAFLAAKNLRRARHSIETARALGATSWPMDAGAVEPLPSVVRQMLGASATDGRVFEIDERSRRPFTDAQLQGLSLLKHLHKLSIQGSPITDVGIGDLGEQAELSWLALDSTKITDKSMARIAKMQALKYLRLSNSQITDLGVARISKLPRLESLCLDGTLITDGIAASVVQMKRLKYLKVDRTAVTLAGANAVWAASPTLSIYPYNPERATRLRARRK